MKKKLTLSELELVSFPTSIRGGAEVVAVQEYKTVHSGVCTCLMDCNTEARLNCTQVCGEEVQQLTGNR